MKDKKKKSQIIADLNREIDALNRIAEMRFVVKTSSGNILNIKARNAYLASYFNGGIDCGKIYAPDRYFWVEISFENEE